MNRIRPPFLFILTAVVALSLAVLLLVRDSVREQNGQQQAAAPLSTDDPDPSLITYDDVVPVLERFTLKKPVTDTPSGYAAFVLCDVDVRQLQTSAEKVAYLALSNVLETNEPPRLTPYVEEPLFPKGVWNRPEIEAIMRPAVERAKQDLLALQNQDPHPSPG